MSHENCSHNHNVKVSRVSPTRVRLTVEYPSESVLEYEKKVAQRYLRQAQIPGFRPGKAPLKLVTEKYKEDIQKDAISTLIREGLDHAIAHEKLEPLSQPRLTKVAERAHGDTKPFDFEAEFDVRPEIKLKKVEGIPLKEHAITASDKEINDTLKNMSERFATMEPLEVEKAPKDSYAVIEIETEVEGQANKVGAPETVTVEVGMNRLLPELDEAIQAAKVGGDWATVESKYADDHNNPEMKGKTAKFKFRVLEVKKRVLPAIDDTLAGQIKPGATLESLKKDLTENIEAMKKNEQKSSYRNQIIEYLVKEHSFEAPASLVEREKYKMLQRLSDEYKRMGRKVEALKEEDKKSLQSRAEQIARGSLLLSEIATQQKFEIKDEELEQKVQAIADEIKRPYEDTYKLLEERGALSEIRDEMLTEKVFEYLTAKAKVMASSPSA